MSTNASRNKTDSGVSIKRLKGWLLNYYLGFFEFINTPLKIIGLH